MIRMLLLLVTVGLCLTLAIQGLSSVTTQEGPNQSVETAIQEAERVKALLDQQQSLLEQRVDHHRDP